MSADLATLSPSARSSNPFEAARLKLVKALLRMPAPVAYPNFPTPGHHEGVAAHLRDAAAIFDEWLAAIGAEVRYNATTSIESGLFAGSFTAAIDGNETYACECEVQSLIDERRAMRRAS
ncbi:MAG: hypothetical protein PS018_17300 [bacterium]|nr:hypothetical protein [bacterium]